MTNTGYGNVESSQTAATFPHSHSHHPQSHEEDDVNLFGPKNCLDNGVHLNRRGQYSIRVNEQWRICFAWRDGEAWEVEIVDYH